MLAAARRAGLASRRVRRSAITERVAPLSSLQGVQRVQRQAMPPLRRSFSDDKGSAAFKDLLKKMQSGGQSDDAREEEKGSVAEGGQPEREAATAEPEPEEESKESTGDEKEEEGKEGTDNAEEEEEHDEKDEDVDKKADEGMKFEMPKFDAEHAQAFVASIPGRSRLFADSFMENVKEAYSELKGENKKKTGLRAKVQQAESFRRGDEAPAEGEGEEKEKEEKDKGPSAMVHVKEPDSEWEKMKQRLADSPLIREILKGSKKAYTAAADTDLGQKVEDAGDRVKEKIEDAKEFWETSQNPVVYAMSGVWDNMTGETEEGICVTEILKLDPGFEKEEWSEEIRVNVVPDIIKAHLTGDTDFLAEHLGEGVLNKLTQDIKLRESDKIEFDSNLLDVDENQIMMKYVEDHGPVIVGTYMVQQINCIRKAGEIIEGSESAVVAKFYSIAFTQEYLEDEGEVRWKIVDYEFGGETPYL